MNRAATKRPAYTKPSMATLSRNAPAISASSRSISTLKTPVANASRSPLSSAAPMVSRPSRARNLQTMSTRQFSSTRQTMNKASPAQQIAAVLPAINQTIRHMSMYNRTPEPGTHDVEILSKLVENKNDYHSLPKVQHKTSQDYISEIPPVVVYGDVAICDGDIITGAGHPREYVKVHKTRPGEPEPCKYCGLRFIKADENQVPLEQ